MEKIFKIISFLCLLAVINGSAHCPDNWTAYKNKCYQLFFEELEWGSALNVCLQYAGHLASPSTSDEHNFVSTHIVGAYDFPIWLGGNDQVSRSSNDRNHRCMDLWLQSLCGVTLKGH